MHIAKLLISCHKQCLMYFVFCLLWLYSTLMLDCDCPWLNLTINKRDHQFRLTFYLAESYNSFFRDLHCQLLNIYFSLFIFLPTSVMSPSCLFSLMSWLSQISPGYHHHNVWLADVSSLCSLIHTSFDKLHGVWAVIRIT